MHDVGITDLQTAQVDRLDRTLATLATIIYQNSAVVYRNGLPRAVIDWRFSLALNNCSIRFLVATALCVEDDSF